MAATAFKQPCPSCDHPILIRDAALVGKKILCPKCKYGFVVQKSAGPALDDTVPTAKAPAKTAAKAKPAAPKPAAGALNVEESDEAVAPPPDNRKKRLMSLALGGVGIVVLLFASYYIFFSKPASHVGPKKPTPKIAPGASDKEDDDDKKTEDANKTKEQPKETKKKVIILDEPTLTPPGPELTNLLPPDTQHVFHGFFKDVFFGPLGEHVIGNKAINDGALRPHLGFTVGEIDDLVRADRFTGTPWTYTVIHLRSIIDQMAVADAFGLKALSPIKGHTYFQATKPNPRFDRLSHVAFGVPQWLRTIHRDDDRPLFVRFHDPQTIIVGDEAPIKALLEADLRFPIQSDDPDAKEKADAKKPLKKADLVLLQTKPYLTIKPKLKDVLDRLEHRADKDPDRPLFSTVTELDPAKISAAVVPPSERGKLHWQGKQVWDVTTLLDERKPRIVAAGSALVQRDAKNYQYRAELDCDNEREARNVLRYCDDVVAPEVALALERYLRLKIDVQRSDAPKGPDIGAGETSRWTAALRDDNVSIDLRLDLVFDNEMLSRVQGLLNLFALAARAEVGLAADARGRHQLGQTIGKLAKSGDMPRKLIPGALPPGTFPRPGSRGDNSPADRLSWMTALLPFLGHDNLAGRVDWNQSWREPRNWMSARTIVPEFLDPTYPESSRFVMVPGMGVAPAATHIVGIAGVGLDAADYDRDDPALDAKRGVFGYDRSATLDDLRKGRGAANVVMMMQIPHDGITGVSPWIAGGGATVRGVPEKNSLAPFVLSTDKSGKAIVNRGKNGTYAIMADGSVRFLNADMPDEVVKALCTVAGPAPQADFFKEAPLIPDPAAKTFVLPKLPSLRPDQKLELAPMPMKAPIDDKTK